MKCAVFSIDTDLKLSDLAVVQAISTPLKEGLLDAMNTNITKLKPETTVSDMIQDGPLSKKKLINCQFCQKVFTKNFDLQQHIR